MKKIARIAFIVHIAFIVIVFAVILLIGDNPENNQVQYAITIGASTSQTDERPYVKEGYKDTIYNGRIYRVVKVWQENRKSESFIQAPYYWYVRNSGDSIFSFVELGNKDSGGLTLISSMGKKWEKWDYDDAYSMCTVVDTNCSFKSNLIDFNNLLKVKEEQYSKPNDSLTGTYFDYFHKDYGFVLSTNNKGEVIANWEIVK